MEFIKLGNSLGKRIFVYVTIIMLSFFSSCNIANFNSKPSDNKDDDNSAGSIQINIPIVSPYVSDSLSLLNSKSITKQTGSKGYIISNRVDLVLRNSIGEKIDQWSVSGDSVYVDGIAKINRTISVGNGYTLEAKLYNLIQSETSPMVWGTSSPFNVKENDITIVDISCIPYSPSLLSINTDFQYTGVPTNFDESQINDGIAVIESYGGEGWLKIVPQSTSVIITADPDSNSSVVIYLFDKEGEYIGFASGPDLTNTPAVLTAFITAGEAYYLGIYPITSNDSISSALTNISYTSGPVDPDDDNDYFETALMLPVEIVQDGMNYDSDYFKITIDSSISNSIKVFLNCSNYNDVQTDYYFYNTSKSQLHYDWAFDGTGSNEYTYFSLSSGTYYFLIKPWDGDAANYTIYWQYN